MYGTSPTNNANFETIYLRFNVPNVAANDERVKLYVREFRTCISSIVICTCSPGKLHVGNSTFAMHQCMSTKGENDAHMYIPVQTYNLSTSAA